ncbi:MAG: TetR/AcrR family transcriptional regulator [Leucobacter sp.]
MSRRDLIADTGVHLIARRGMRGLTHLQVDAEAGLPKGSTSYYARTRDDLIALVVHRLSEGSEADLGEFTIPDALTRSEAAQLTTAMFNRMMTRTDAQAARFTLLVELRQDEELRRALTEDAPVRTLLIDAARAILAAAKVSAPDTEASNLVGLVDALLMYRTAQAPVDIGKIIATYFAGLPRRI